MDVEYTHHRLMTAIEGVADRKGLKDYVSVRGGGGFGRSVRIFDALKHGKKLEGDFHAELLPIVDRAFKALGRERPSDRIADVADALLKHLSPQPPSRPRAADGA